MYPLVRAREHARNNLEKENVMTVRRRYAAIAAVALLVFAIGAVVGKIHSAEAHQTNDQPVHDEIVRALSAGPDNVTRNATVAEPDGQGGLKILRQGTNDFTCMPGDPNGIGMPPMCADQAAMQWDNDFREHKPKPTTTVPGIEYMLAGATQRSDSDPFDKASPPIKIGPHWMILWPFDPKTSGLPTTHKPTGAYIMWAGSPWAHVHIMGRP
jgi:hypothetical protein